MKAKQMLNEYHSVNGGGYGEVEKHLILDFINEKQRIEREREAKYQADLAYVETTTILKEQVRVLKEQIKSTSDDARKAHTQSMIANFISMFSIVVAVIALLMQLK